MPTDPPDKPERDDTPLTKAEIRSAASARRVFWFGTSLYAISFLMPTVGSETTTIAMTLGFAAFLMSGFSSLQIIFALPNLLAAGPTALQSSLVFALYLSSLWTVNIPVWIAVARWCCGNRGAKKLGKVILAGALWASAVSLLPSEYATVNLKIGYYLWIASIAFVGLAVLTHPVVAPEPTTPKCENCGYDLRASKKRCPECGTAIAPKPG